MPVSEWQQVSVIRSLVPVSVKEFVYSGKFGVDIFVDILGK